MSKFFQNLGLKYEIWKTEREIKSLQKLMGYAVPRELYPTGSLGLFIDDVVQDDINLLISKRDKLKSSTKENIEYAD